MARNTRLVINISEEIKYKLERIAKERGISVSALCAAELGKYVWYEELEETWRYEQTKQKSNK